MPLALAVMLPCLAACAEEAPHAKLDAVQKALSDSRQRQQALTQQAAALAAELAQLRAESVAAAQSVQAHEEALTRLESQLATLAIERTAKAAELARQRQEQTGLLTALLRLARDPPSGLALGDGTPIDLLRGGILMGAAVPPLVERATLLGIELKTLADLGDQIEAAEARHRIEGDALAQEKARIDQLVVERAALQQQTQQDAAETAHQVQTLAAQASDLKDLIDRSEAAEKARLAAAVPPPPRPDRPEAETRTATASSGLLDPTRPSATRPFSEARGRLLYPAAGSVVLDFGSADPSGTASKGMTLETRPGAQVVAPFDGQVLFAGPFKGYGQILIIGHGDGYHSLVAGLDRIDSVVGQWLVAGEPIGVMPAGGAKPRLYLELRHDGQPINPLPWLATHDAKVNG